MKTDIRYFEKQRIKDYGPGQVNNSSLIPNQNRYDNMIIKHFNSAEILGKNNISLEYNQVNKIPSQMMEKNKMVIQNPCLSNKMQDSIKYQKINSNQGMTKGLPNLYNQNVIAYNAITNANKYVLNISNNLKLHEIPNVNNIIQTQTIDQVYTGHLSIPLKVAEEIKQSICKIIIHYNNNKTQFGTGFFINFSDSLKLLITNYHVINPKLMNLYIEIQIWNQKSMLLNCNERYIKFIKKPGDIIAIEIKESDEIYNYIKFLNYNTLYNRLGYRIYDKNNVFTIHHPLGEEAAVSSGQINGIDGIEFDHNISTEKGSSGCPIISLDSRLVIGVHKNTNDRKKNGGTFIGEIIKEINKNLPSEYKAKNKNLSINQIRKSNDNYIFGEINIKKENINKNIRIINSYEEYMRINIDYKFNQKLMNEKQIKDCEIKINNELIPFNYKFKFKNEGIYIISYKFNNNLTNINHMFYGCDSLTYLNLTNFNDKNVTDMSYMFYGCNSLFYLNVSNFNPVNAIDMNHMFCDCYSLTHLDLSDFNIQKVIDMSYMFHGCNSLDKLELVKFNTENVTNMCYMFYGCKSLKYLDLVNFNTQKVTDMGGIFHGCNSLTNLDLSNFDTSNVTNMSGMFCECYSLNNLKLSNFDTSKVKDMSYMFNECKSLDNLDLSNFDIEKVTNMCYMFYGCNSLISLSLSNYNIQKFIHLSDVLNGCVSLKKENIMTVDYETTGNIINSI